LFLHFLDSLSETVTLSKSLEHTHHSLDSTKNLSSNHHHHVGHQHCCYSRSRVETDEEIEAELKQEGLSIQKCIRIKAKTGQETYMIRVLTSHQETIDDLLMNDAYIYTKRYRVEPSHSSPPLPLRCEKCQLNNSHPTAKCPNDTYVGRGDKGSVKRWKC